MKNYKQYKNYNYEFTNDGTCRNIITGKILKRYYRPDGYVEYTLCDNGKKIRVLEHRVVAEIYLENVKNLPQVNHKDENKRNNHVSNLEWCDGKYNSNYGTGKIRMGAAHGKKVKQISLDGKVVKIFNSMAEASKVIGIGYDNISRVCNKYRKSAGGFLWEFC